MQGVGAHQLGQLQEVGDAAGLLERLVQLTVGPEHAEVGPELLLQLGDPGEGLLQAGFRAGHAALVPHQLAQLAVDRVDGALPLDFQQRADVRRRTSASASRNAGCEASTASNLVEAR